jgi:serine/threonine protein kinase/TolB-like protein
MTPELWQKVDHLLGLSLDLDPQKRAEFLDNACAGDDLLRREVESLLSAHDSADGFIEELPSEEVIELFTDSPESLRAGESVGHYKVISRIGAGGMGEIYLADDARLGRRVALKLLPGHLTQDRVRLLRFEQEARAVAALSHPNVCMIHEMIETEDGHPCIVMEYVEGETLRERLTGSPMKLSEALDISIQVASALGGAHGAGIIHRDIKPENIMVRRDGYVKVLDFGLAKLAEDQTAAGDSSPQTIEMISTEAGLVMGTVSYMSPEHARGLTVDPRTDIWSLGVVLYEMITGKRPFVGETNSDIVAALLTSEPPPLSQQVSEAQPGIERIIGKCLMKDREARYQSAAQLLDDLRSVNQGHKPEAAVEAMKSAGRGATHTTRRALIFSALAALAVAVLIYAWLSRAKPSSPQPEVKTLAVLPFKSLSAEAGDHYLGLGIADAIITRTSRMGSLVVRPTSAVRGYHEKETDPLEAARQLQVDAVLDGSVQRVGDHLRISLNLLRARDGVSLWAGTFDREMKNAFALQDDISLDVVKALKVTLTASEEGQFARHPTENAEAYDYYLRGRYYLTRDSAGDSKTALTLFERATTLDPYFALAYAGVADASTRIFFGVDNDSIYEEKAFVALEKALALDPNLAEAYVIRANLSWNIANGFPHEKAFREHQRALAINPNLANAHASLAGHIIHIGLLDRAMDELQAALRLDPDNRFAEMRVARIYWYQQRYELALALYEKSASGGFLAEKALTLWHLGRKDEAFAEVEKSLKQPSLRRGSRADIHSVFAILLADNGRRREAQQQIRLAIENGEGMSHFHHAAFSIACAYALIGEKELALKWLETTAEQGMPCYPLFNTEPALNNLRDDPRFAEFMEKIKKQYEGYLRELG